MSKKLVISSLAMAVAMTFTGSALASATVSPGATPVTFAKEVLGVNAANGDPTLNVNSAVTFKVSAPDILIGRTSASGDITVQMTFAGADVDAAVTPTITFAQDPSLGQVNATSITINGNTIQFTISPLGDQTTGGFIAGDLFTVSGVAFKNAGGLSSGVISASAVVLDTNTGTQLTSASAATLVNSDFATTTTLTGDTDTIDVGVPAQKKMFVGGNTLTTMGTVQVSSSGLTVNGTGATANSSGGDGTGSFVYDTANDMVDLTLNVANDSAFTADDAFYATTDESCSGFATNANPVGFVKNTTTGKYEASVPVTSAEGGMYTLCAQANGTDEIVAQSIGLNAQVNLAGDLTIDPPAASKADFTVWSYNGSVVDVYNVNPGGNSLAQSFVRIINKGTVAGKVTIDGYDDTGAHFGPISLTSNLGAGAAKQINSDALEDAAKATAAGLSGPLGDGVGKWRLRITGEFPNMVVQSLNRNSSTGTVTNLTDADTKQEQYNNSDSSSL